MIIRYMLGQVVRVIATRQIGHVKSIRVNHEGVSYCLDELPLWLPEAEIEPIAEP